jgi:hypothetical protein
VIDGDRQDPPSESSDPSSGAVVRLLGTIAVFVILAMLLLAAAGPPGCGGG